MSVYVFTQASCELVLWDIQSWKYSVIIVSRYGQDGLFAAIVAGHGEGDICSLITYRCVARLITFLNQNRHVVGVEAGTCDRC
jgi:hypothetical protein